MHNLILLAALSCPSLKAVVRENKTNYPWNKRDEAVTVAVYTTEQCIKHDHSPCMKKITKLDQDAYHVTCGAPNGKT